MIFVMQIGPHQSENQIKKENHLNFRKTWFVCLAQILENEYVYPPKVLETAVASSKVSQIG